MRGLLKSHEAPKFKVFYHNHPRSGGRKSLRAVALANDERAWRAAESRREFVGVSECVCAARNLPGAEDTEWT
jgi:hypothetical protein